VRELRLLILAVLVVVVGWNLVPLPQGSARPADAASEVRRVFTLAFDQSRSLEDRLRYIEDGGAIRTKVDNVRRARVHAVRVHANRAEVDFEFVNPSGESLGRVLPFGVVVPDGGRWKVSRHTICALALVAGATACPGMSPTEDWRAYWMGERFDRQMLTDGTRVVMPLTFLDGASAQLVLPAGVDPRGGYVTGQAVLEFGDHAVPVSASYRARRAPVLARYRGVPLDYEGNLNFVAGGWTVRVYAADLSERDRAFLARHVGFRSSSDGLVALGRGRTVRVAAPPAASSAVGRSIRAKGVLDETGLPTLSFSPDGAGGVYGRFELAHTGCVAGGDGDRPGADEGARVGLRCIPGTGIELGAEGFDAAFVNRLLTETEIHDVRERR
jgi:hypothetical protein